MARPNSVVRVLSEAGFDIGEDKPIYEYTNDTDEVFEPRYASITARTVVACIVFVVAPDGNTNVVDYVFAGNGGSHSWWKEAGGGLLKYPLKPGYTLRVEVSGPAAFRIDWY